MISARIVACLLAVAAPLALAGCPGKSASPSGGHDPAYYNTHLKERQATLDRCNALDPSQQTADKDCQAAVYSTMYGPSLLKTPKT